MASGGLGFLTLTLGIKLILLKKNMCTQMSVSEGFFFFFPVTTLGNTVMVILQM